MNLSTLRAAAVAAAALVTAACATTSSTPPQTTRSSGSDCFFASTLRDWRPLDDENLILFAQGRRPYHVELVRPATNLSRNARIGVYDRDGSICAAGGDAIVIDGAIPDRIRIGSLRRIERGELDALYTEFGIRTPVVIDAEEVELPESDDNE